MVECIFEDTFHYWFFFSNQKSTLSIIILQENTLDEDMDGYHDVLNRRIERQGPEWERDDESSEQDGGEQLNNIEQLLRAMHEDCVRDCVSLLNIC